MRLWFQRALDRKWLLYALLVFSFALHLTLLSALPELSLKGDQRVYFRQSKRLVAQGLPAWEYDARAPGYIFFVALNFWQAGEPKRVIVRIAQSLLDVGTAAMLYAMTCLAFPSLALRRRQVIALLTTGLFVLNPDYVFFSQTMWSETLFVFLVAFAFCVLLRARRLGSRWYWFLASGILLGCAALTREIVLVFGAVFVPMWLVLVGRPNWRVSLQRVALLLLGVALVSAPYAYRNYVNGHGLELISWQGPRDLWKYNLIALVPGTNHREIRKTLTVLDPATRNSELNWRTLRLIETAPLRWALAKAYGAAGLWTDIESNVYVYGKMLGLISPADFTGWRNALRVYLVILTNLIVVGLIFAGDTREKLLWALYLASTLLIFYATFYATRFRLPLTVIFLPYAAWTIVSMFLWLTRRERPAHLNRRTLTATAGLLILLNWQALPFLIV